MAEDLASLIEDPLLLAEGQRVQAMRERYLHRMNTDIDFHRLGVELFQHTPHPPGWRPLYTGPLIDFGPRRKRPGIQAKMAAIRARQQARALNRIMRWVKGIRPERAQRSAV